MKNSKTYCCPHCGEEIGIDAKACPFCGSDENTGWSEATYLDGIELPAEDEYDSLVRNEFGTATKSRRRTWIAVVAAVILALFLFGIFSMLR
jgi:hypothetical protein